MTIGWEKLGAYVDGELSPQERAIVAARLARDPDLAARVASLAQLKASIARGDMESVSAPAGSQQRHPTASRPRRVHVGLGVGAALVVAVLSALQFSPTVPVLELTPLSKAASLHEAWLSDFKTPNTGALGALAAAPDLSAAKLKLVHVIGADQGARHSGTSFFGYMGPNGCRLGLWIGPKSSEGSSTPQAVRLGELAGYVWQRKRREYAVVARGMDPRRLASFAAIIAQIIDRNHRLDDALSMALSNSSKTGSACS